MEIKIFKNIISGHQNSASDVTSVKQKRHYGRAVDSSDKNIR